MNLIGFRLELGWEHWCRLHYKRCPQCSRRTVSRIHREFARTHGRTFANSSRIRAESMRIYGDCGVTVQNPRSGPSPTPLTPCDTLEPAAHPPGVRLPPSRERARRPGTAECTMLCRAINVERGRQRRAGAASGRRRRACDARARPGLPRVESLDLPTLWARGSVVGGPGGSEGGAQGGARVVASLLPTLAGNSVAFTAWVHNNQSFE